MSSARRAALLVLLSCASAAIGQQQPSLGRLRTSAGRTAQAAPQAKQAMQETLPVKSVQSSATEAGLAAQAAAETPRAAPASPAAQRAGQSEGSQAFADLLSMRELPAQPKPKPAAPDVGRTAPVLQRSVPAAAAASAQKAAPAVDEHKSVSKGSAALAELFSHPEAFAQESRTASAAQVGTPGLVTYSAGDRRQAAQRAPAATQKAAPEERIKPAASSSPFEDWHNAEMDRIRANAGRKAAPSTPAAAVKTAAAAAAKPAEPASQRSAQRDAFADLLNSDMWAQLNRPAQPPQRAAPEPKRAAPTAQRAAPVVQPERAASAQRSASAAYPSSLAELQREAMEKLYDHTPAMRYEEDEEDTHEMMAESIMDGFDANKDGKISLYELMDHVGDESHNHPAFQGWHTGFNQADADNDMHLTLKELGSLLKNVDVQEEEEEDSILDEEENVHTSTATSIMQGLDANGDGKISLQELLSNLNDEHHNSPDFKGWHKGFKQADADNDLHLTVQELANLLMQTNEEEL